jgi:trehalose 6-phosphate synthase
MLSWEEDPYQYRLGALCQQILSERSLFIASNRGPIEYHIAEDGKLKGKLGGGGVVTALLSLSRYAEFTWVAAPMSKGDRQAAQMSKIGRLPSPPTGRKFSLRFVLCPQQAYHKYYYNICNPVLWFLQHYMWDQLSCPDITGEVYDAWENGYVPVNQAFAQALITETEKTNKPPLVLLQDYHLYLVAGYIRRQIPDAIIQHFIHIPWPDPRYWQRLPAPMRQAILENLCATDIVGLQTKQDMRNFLHTCESTLTEAKVDYQNHTVHLNGHLTKVISYPVSVDVVGLRKLALSPQVEQYEKKVRPYLGEQTIIRVDRADPSKNIVRGLKAFDLLLERYPQFQGKARFLFFLVPSRTEIKEYQDYAQEIEESVTAINDKYGTSEWQPITVFYENNRPQAIAGMRHYDVLLVNSIADGMNLVAKEGPIVNTCDGVLILSETTGAHEQLKKGALSVAPTDLEETTQALYAALTMDPWKRERRAKFLRRAIESDNITRWLSRQLKDVQDLIQRQPAKARSRSALPPLPHLR